MIPLIKPYNLLLEFIQNFLSYHVYRQNDTHMIYTDNMLKKSLISFFHCVLKHFVTLRAALVHTHTAVPLGLQ